MLAKNPINLQKPANVDAYGMLEKERAGQFFGTPWKFPARFPINTYVPIAFLKYLSLHKSGSSDLVEKAFEALAEAQWYHGKSIVEEAEVREIVKPLFKDAAILDELFEKVSDPETKSLLKSDAEKLVQQGAFGFP